MIFIVNFQIVVAHFVKKQIFVKLNNVQNLQIVLV